MRNIVLCCKYDLTCPAMVVVVVVDGLGGRMIELHDSLELHACEAGQAELAAEERYVNLELFAFHSHVVLVNLYLQFSE